MLIWRSTQFYDDIADGDEVTREELDLAIWDHFITLPSHPFVQKNGQTIQPVLANLVLKWQASDKAERAGRADARSYMWRAGYYDVLMMVVCIEHGPMKANALSEHVMGLYGETYKDYKKEFKNV